MLKIAIKEQEYFDDETSSFITIPKVNLVLEHSLVSLSKWESIHEKPFLIKEAHSQEETLSYIKCMVLNEEDIPEEVFAGIQLQDLQTVSDYIRKKMTATWFSDEQKKSSGTGETITSELIYYWMISLSIPFECQHWHLERLLTLIRVCSMKNQPAKKMSKSELAARNRALNEQRLAQYNTTG